MTIYICKILVELVCAEFTYTKTRVVFLIRAINDKMEEFREVVEVRD